jgi:hypothetical protein
LDGQLSITRLISVASAPSISTQGRFCRLKTAGRLVMQIAEWEHFSESQNTVMSLVLYVRFMV